MRAVRFVAQRDVGPRALDQFGGWDDVVAIALGELKGEWETEGIHYQVDLGRRPSTRPTYPLCGGPPLPPAACWCARFVVLSMLCHSASMSV